MSKSASYSTSQTVEVTAAAPMVDMTTSSTNTRVDANLPHRSLDELGKLYDTSAPKEAKSKRALLEAKADNDLFATWECFWVTAAKVTIPEACGKLPKDKVHITLTLQGNSPELLAKLQKLGYVPDQKSTPLVGSISIDKLAQLAAIPEVTFIKYTLIAAKK